MISAPSLERSAFSESVLCYFGAVLVCLWLLACVLTGATDLRRELHELGLD